MSNYFPNQTDRRHLLRQQIQGYLCEPTVQNTVTRPLFDACILWSPRASSPLAAYGSTSDALISLLAQKAKNRELPKPGRNVKLFFETDTGCVFLSYELWETTGSLFAMSLPISASDAASTYRLFAKGKNVQLSCSQNTKKTTDASQIARLAALFDLIEATRDTLLPEELRMEALAAIFGLAKEHIEIQTIPSLRESDALVALIRRLMEAATTHVKESEQGSELCEKV